MADVGGAQQSTTPEWLGGVPLAARVAELNETGMSDVDALLHLLEWAIRARPQEEVELTRRAVEPYQDGMAPEVVSDLRWLLGFAELRNGRYAQALTLLAPLSQFDKLVDRALGPHERGPQVLASVLVAQTFRELGARTAASDEATKAVDWLGDLGATDFDSCSITAERMWKGAYLLGFELEIGLADDALAEDDLAGAGRHAVAARRWLPPRALDKRGRVPWRYRIMLLLLWSKLALARGWTTTALRNTEFALQIAEQHQALPDLARCWYQHGRALLGSSFDPIEYLLDPGGRQPLPRPIVFGPALGRAAAMAESAGMSELASTAHLTLAALFAPHDRELTLLHIDRAIQTAGQIGTQLPSEFMPWWELSRMAKLRLVHIIAHDVPIDHELWTRGAGREEPNPGPDDSGPDDSGPDDSGPDDFGPDDSGPDDTEEDPPVPGLDDIPQPPDLEDELRTALRHAGYALADETGAGAVITPADDLAGLVVSWRSAPELSSVEGSLSADMIMKDLAQILDTLGFLARRYERDPARIIVKGTYSPMLAADDEDGGDRAGRWFRGETEARRVHLSWLADTKVYDVAGMREGVAGHPLRDLVVRILVALDGAGLPLQVDWPGDGYYDSAVGVSVFPHDTYDHYVMVSWESGKGGVGAYQREVFRSASRALIERILNAAGIVTSGHLTDGTVYVFAKAQEITLPEPTHL